MFQFSTPEARAVSPVLVVLIAEASQLEIAKPSQLHKPILQAAGISTGYTWAHVGLE